MNLSSLRRVLLRAQPFLLLAGFGFIGLLLAEQWESLREFEWRPSLGWLAVSGLCILAGWGIEIRLWQRLLSLLGGRLTFPEAVGIWFASSIVRYVPGNVWQPLSMTVLCGTRGIEPQVSLASTLLFHTIHLLTVALVTAVYAAAMRSAGATMLASLSGWWAAALAAPVILFLLRPRAALNLANALLVRFGRAPLRSQVSTGALLRLFAVCLGSWLAVCAGFTALIRALGLRGEAGFAETLAQVGTAYPVAYAIGFLSFVTPGGLAIREGVLVLLLTPTFGRAPSLVVALAMRAWELTLEAVIGGSVVGFGRLTSKAGPNHEGHDTKLST